MGIGNAMLSKTYFQGVAGFMDAVSHPDEEANKWSQGFATGFVPQLVNRAGNATDDWMRAHYDMMDAIEARIFGLRQNLPVQRTLWGDPVPTRDAFAPLLPQGLARIVSPIPLGKSPEDVEPIDKWIWENRDAFGISRQGEARGIPKPGRFQTYQAKGSPGVVASVELDPVAYDRLQFLAGQGLRDPKDGLGTKEKLNSLVAGVSPDASEQREWDNGSSIERALMVKSIVGKMREAAKEQIRQEFPRVEAAIQAQWDAAARVLKAGSAGTP
jgi:hypothetical protein